MFNNALPNYLDKRCLRIFSLGIASGFPWVLIGSMLSIALKEHGFSRTTIGFTGLIFGVYSINFLWAPLVDRVRLPIIGKLGQRRSYILLGQAAITLCCLLLSNLDFGSDINTVVVLCLIIAIASASQDIAIDAYRIDSLPDNEPDYQASGAAMATAGWWTGYAGLGFLPFFLSDVSHISWADLYGLMAIIPIALMGITLMAPEPKSQQREESQLEETQHYFNAMPSISKKRKVILVFSLLSPIGVILWAFFDFIGLPESIWQTPIALLLALTLISIIIIQLNQLERLLSTSNPLKKSRSRIDNTLSWLLVTLASPIKDFFNRSGTKAAISLLLFIFLFKIGEAFLGRMSIVFYKEVGFSNLDIGLYSKLMSWAVAIVFAGIGGWFVHKKGIYYMLVMSGIAMASSNLMFALMALHGPSETLFALTVLIDGFTTAWSTVAFVTFISLLCSRAFTATQYALLASLGTLGRTLLSSSSGLLVDWLDGNWVVFFVLTSLMVLPALVLLWWAKNDINQLQQ